ncbi:hypothetical protein [Nostoc sp. ChiSLP03a]|nr:hypothetical protein [Nostoc sp. ChiSLP03a]
MAFEEATQYLYILYVLGFTRHLQDIATTQSMYRSQFYLKLV